MGAVITLILALLDLALGNRGEDGPIAWIIEVAWSFAVLPAHLLTILLRLPVKVDAIALPVLPMCLVLITNALLFLLFATATSLLSTYLSQKFRRTKEE